MVDDPALLWIAPLAAALLCALAEGLHWMRTRRLAFLAFGPRGRARWWTAAVPPLRTACAAALAFGFVALIQVPEEYVETEVDPELHPARHHLVLALDVSPSMHIPDSGPKGGAMRADRARELARSILDRLDMTRTRVSIVAFYTEAKPVVVDTYDPEVLRNIFDDLPLAHAFEHGKTDLYEGVRVAAEVARAFPPDTASLLVVSDGDTLPASGLPRLPPSVANFLVLGVGDPYKGVYIDGHSSRQNRESLNRLALRLDGQYHDGNHEHVPTAVLRRFTSSLAVIDERGLDLRAFGLLAVGLGSAILALLSPALALAGAPRNEPRESRRRTAPWLSGPMRGILEATHRRGAGEDSVPRTRRNRAAVGGTSGGRP